MATEALSLMIEGLEAHRKTVSMHIRRLRRLRDDITRDDKLVSAMLLDPAVPGDLKKLLRKIKASAVTSPATLVAVVASTEPPAPPASVTKTTTKPKNRLEKGANKPRKRQTKAKKPASPAASAEAPVAPVESGAPSPTPSTPAVKPTPKAHQFGVDFLAAKLLTTQMGPGATPATTLEAALDACCATGWRGNALPGQIRVDPKVTFGEDLANGGPQTRAWAADAVRRVELAVTGRSLNAKKTVPGDLLVQLTKDLQAATRLPDIQKVAETWGLPTRA